MSRSSAEAFLEQVFQSNPYEFLCGLLDPPTQETEWLDFKGSPKAVDVLKIWSEAISGFANSDGGIVIWGIDARRDQTTGIDAASNLSLIPDPTALRSRLQQNVINAVEPPVTGIEIREVKGADGTGFVVCFIPQGTDKPHRAELKTNRPYCIRVGDSFAVAPRSLLKHMFYPVVTPTIRVFVRPYWTTFGTEKDIGAGKASFMCRVDNVGQASAYDLYIQISTSIKHAEFKVLGDSWRETKVGTAYFGCVCNLPFHPGMFGDFGMFEAVTGVELVSLTGLDFEGQRPRLENVEFTFTVFARDYGKHQMMVSFSTSELLSHSHKRATPISNEPSERSAISSPPQ